MHLIQLDCYNNDINISAFLNITKLDIEIQNTTSITFQLFARNIRTIFCNDTIRCKLFHAFCNRYIMSSLICLILLSTFTFTHASIIQLLISATSSLMSTIYLIALFLGDLTLHTIHLPIRLVISCLSLPISMAKIYLPSFLGFYKMKEWASVSKSRPSRRLQTRADLVSHNLQHLHQNLSQGNP